MMKKQHRNYDDNNDNNTCVSLCIRQPMPLNQVHETSPATCGDNRPLVGWVLKIYLAIFEGIDARMNKSYGGFLSHGGVPPNQPFYFRIFYKNHPATGDPV